MCPRLSCSRTLSLCPQSRQKSGKAALATWNCSSARIITGFNVCAVPCIPLPSNPFSTGAPAIGTLRAGLPVLATTAAAGGFACASFAGSTGDGLNGAASAKAAVVAEVTGGTIGAGTAAVWAVPATAAGGSGRVAVAVSPVEGSAGAVPWTFIDEPPRADALASSDTVEAADREQPAIGSAAKPSSKNPAANPLSALPHHLM